MRVYTCGSKKPFDHVHLTPQSIGSINDQNLKIKFISCGANHVILVTQDNQVWVAGENAYGELGIGTTESHKEFVQVRFTENLISSSNDDKNIDQIVCGMHSSAIVTGGGKRLYVCGNNEHGMLGLGDKKLLYQTEFSQVTLPENCGGVKQIAMGGDHCLLIGQDGQLYACGSNSDGQLGIKVSNDNENLYYSFTRVCFHMSLNQQQQQHIKFICCGYRHSLLSTNDNVLWVCGANKCGQLGMGEGDLTATTNMISTFTPCKELSELMMMGKHTSTTTSTRTTTHNIKQIFAGWYHSEVLTDHGILFTCGSNSHGELGDCGLPEKNSYHFRQVNPLSYNILISQLCMTCPTGSTMALMKTPTTTKTTTTTSQQQGTVLLASGYNHYHQLCLGDRTHRTDLTKVPLHFSSNEERVEMVAHGSRITAIVTGEKEASKP